MTTQGPTPAPPGSICAGERRRCSSRAVVVRQGRYLCAACDDIRKASRNRRSHRRTKAVRTDERVSAIETLVRGPGRPALDPDAGELPPRSVRLGPEEEAKVLRVQGEMQGRVRAAGGTRTVSFSEALRHVVRVADV